MYILEKLRRGLLAGAHELSLANCGLTECPSEIFGLAETLEVLDLSGNRITALPDDFSRLKKLRVLFCSGNRFSRMPPVLGDCAALSQIGFRRTGLIHIPAEALPPDLRWLTLTDNQIETLPDAIGDRKKLQKLMLAGNRLERLPESLAEANNLELLRLSANRLEVLPRWLGASPCLAWVAWAGNPLDAAIGSGRFAPIRWADVSVDGQLGEGASGRVFRAVWRPNQRLAGQDAALKLFKDGMTSDGLPEREMAACLAAGRHPNLIGSIGRLSDHPQGAQGLLMPLVAAHWTPLAAPPSLESCSRDIYDTSCRFTPDVVVRIAACVGAAAAHLHSRGLLHGDLYAHNTLWDGLAGDAVLSDFGAASFMPPGSHAELARVEVLAWGRLLGELLDRCHSCEMSALRTLYQDCIHTDPMARPSLRDALDILRDNR